MRGALFAALLLFCGSGAAAGPPVDMALVLAVDTSSSVTDGRYRIQMDGLADALESDRVAQAVLAGPIGRIAVYVIQWASQSTPSTGWVMVETRADLLALAAIVREKERDEHGSTCMGQAMAASMRAFDHAPDAARRVIDVSGDGSSNCHDEAAIAAAFDTDPEVIVNGLPIEWISAPDDQPNEDGLVEWYEQHVRRGLGSFIEPARGSDDIARAFARKLVTEIACSTRPCTGRPGFDIF